MNKLICVSVALVFLALSGCKKCRSCKVYDENDNRVGEYQPICASQKDLELYYNYCEQGLEDGQRCVCDSEF